MSAYLRPWLLLVALLYPGTARVQPAEHDWRPVIVQPSPWDWCGRACFDLPNLGKHRIERGSR